MECHGMCHHNHVEEYIHHYGRERVPLGERDSETDEREEDRLVTADD